MNSKKMLEKIKSSYFLKNIFSYIYEGRKLKLAKYNNSLKIKIDINLINYKLFSGKYIIYSTENKVKEYNSYNEELIFEGEYLNGKRSGKGKVYGILGR